MSTDFRLPAPDMARLLIGWKLLVTTDGVARGGIITETEAYTRDDPASHSFSGLTNRNNAMFMPGGTVYIYFIYGRYYCFNIVCGNQDGQAVLIRSIVPTVGVNYMKKRRGITHDKTLADGPAKLFQALGMDTSWNQSHISRTPITLLPPQHTPTVLQGPRTGIAKATDTPWRFYLSN